MANIKRLSPVDETGADPLVDPKTGIASIAGKVLLATVAGLLNRAGGSTGSLGVALRSYAKASLPPATDAGRMIFVTDDAGGATPAFSDGTDWRRTSDRNVIS